jgi:sec-independent protein translocase protein TatA
VVQKRHAIAILENLGRGYAPLSDFAENTCHKLIIAPCGSGPPVFAGRDRRACYHGLETSLEDYKMFGTLGVPEMMVIFIVALVLFGPKKLPEIGRNVGKAITEFRRASSELKETFNKEIQQLENETAPIKDAARDLANQYQNEPYNYDYSSNPYEEGSPYGSETSTATDPSSEGASATQGAELTSAGTYEHEGEPAQETASAGTPELQRSEGHAPDNEPPVSAEHKA